MSEEKYLQFSNNKDKYTWNTDGKINKNKFAEGSKIRKFLDIFDKNGDGIIEGKEIASLFGSLEISANKNGNSVFETKEAEEYLENTKDIDGKSLKEDGISANELFGFVKTIMKKSQNTEIQNINIGETEYSYEETENIAIKNISKDVQSARELFRDQMSQSGSVSKFADWVKDIFGSDNVSYKIDETLAWEALSASLLEQAQTGDLTVRSYLEQKLQLAYALLPDPDEGLFGGLIDNLSKISAKELEKLGIKLNKNISKENKEKYIKAEILKKALENLKPEELEVYMINLSQASTDERAEISKQMTQDIVGKFLGSKEVSFSTTSGTKKQKIKNPQYDEAKAQAAAKWNKEHPDSSSRRTYTIPKYIEIEVPDNVPSLVVGNPSNRDGSLGEIKNIQADKIKSFEETFFDERGVQYNPQAIMDYEQKNAGTQFLVQMHNTIQNLKLSIYKASSKVDANIHNHTGLEYPEDTLKLNQVLCNNLAVLYNGDTEKIQAFITSVLGENVTIEETNTNKIFKTREIKHATNTQLVKLGNAIIEMMENNYQKALGGKTLEQHAQETKNAYEKAYGHNNILDKVNEYIESQQESVGNIHTAIFAGSMICMIGGQLIPVGGQAGAALIAAGMTGATFGSPMLEFTEKVTSENGISKEELKDIGIEIIQNAAMLAAGIKSGQISSKAYLSMVAQKMPKLVAFAGEIGIDSTIGILSTLAITGELDITGEGISQIQAFLVGLAHSKFKMGRFFDTHAGDVHTKRTEEETPHTKTYDETSIHSTTPSKVKPQKLDDTEIETRKFGSKLKDKSLINDKTQIPIEKYEQEILAKFSDSARRKTEDLMNSDIYKNISYGMKKQWLDNIYNQAKIFGQLKDNYIPDINTIKQKMEYIEDEKINSYIKQKLENLENLSDTEKNAQLLELEYLTDAINVFNNNYSMIHTSSSLFDSPAAQSHRIKAIDKKLGGDLNYKPEIQDKISEHLKYDGLKNYITKYSETNPEMSDYVYALYLDKLTPEIRTKCYEISKTTGTKIFIDKTDTELLKHLNIIQTELKLWKESGLKVPTILDEFDASTSFIWVEMQKAGQAAAFTNPDTNTISLSISNIKSYNVNLKEILRHELTHLNDPNFESVIWDKNNPIHNEITANREKYKQYLKDAGANENDIEYAFSAPREFSAVAAQLNTTKYPKDFKTLLIKMGVPEQLFKFEEVNPKTKTIDETKISDKEIIQSVQTLRQQYLDSKKTLDKIFDDSGLNNLEGLERFESRVKSESSLKDKIRNYLKDNPNATIEEALTAEIRDAYGARTILKTDIDYTNHPEVKALLEAGDERGAMLKAAELQSAPAVKQLKRMIDMIASGEADFEITRITNYVSKDGIPYFSENQLADIAWYAAKKGIKGFDQVIRIENNKAIDAKGKNITKSQPSGYSALQMNIKTKDGKVLEWQMRGKDVNDFAEGEHIPYDLRTGKNILGDHPELEPLYKPLQELLCGTGEEKIGKMPDEAYKEYNRYLDNYYTYLRKKELGFEADEPKLFKYGKGYKFDEKLDAQNLIKLHEIAQKVKDGKITVEKALSDYERAIVLKKEFDNLLDKYKDNPLQMLEDINVGETIQKAQAQGRQDVIYLINKAYELVEEAEKQLKTILNENPELKQIYDSDRYSKIIIDRIFEAEYNKNVYDPETGIKLDDEAKINHVKRVLNENLDDIKKDIKFSDIKSKLESQAFSSTEKAAIYEKYLDEEFGKNTTGKYANVRKLCEKIDKEFDVKIILPANVQEAGVALKLIYQELTNFRMHAVQNGATANFPQAMEFSHISYDGFIKGDAAGVALRNPFNGIWENINVDGLNIKIVKYVLRHELTHVNDKLDIDEFPQDIDVKKYAQEFLNAGIYVEHIPYAYKNRREFIAVASEGDMRAYSDEFKEVLKKLGMPEWMLTMQNMRLSNKPVTQYDKLRLKELMDKLEVGNKDTNTEINVPYKTNNKFLAKKQPYKLDLKNLPVLELPNGQIINLNNYASAIYKLHEGQKIIIGREGNIKINDPSGKVSRNHIVIYKQNGVLKLQDISTNGTKIVEKYSKYNGNTPHNQYYNTSAYPKIETPKKNPQQLIKGQKYLLEPYTNPNTSITLGGIISVDVNSNLFRKMFSNLKEGEEFTVGSWEGNADYKIGSSDIGVSRIHLVVRKENGKMVIIDKSSFGSTIINNHCDPVTPKDVKKMFGGGIFTKGSLTPTYLQSQVYNHLQINKENFFDLDKEDYRIISELMNKENGKYIHIWNATSKTDQMKNIEKLAIMVKVLRKTGAVNDFINLGPNEWELVVNGCCNKTRFAIDSILNYKQNSNFMNKILSGDNYNIEKYGPYINRLTTFLNMQVINKKVKLYRGEGYNGTLSLIKTKNGIPVGKAMENLIKKGASNYEIMKFIDEELMGLNVTQERFMSTTFTKEFAQNWAQNGSMGADATNGCIRWDIYAPAGTKGAFVEDLNLYYGKENEVLIQRNSTLAITNVKFDWNTKTWVIEATIVQDKIPQ